MVAKGPRMTGPTRAVLDVFLTAPDTEHHGLAIGAATRLPSGTIHPILARLEGLGWLTSTWSRSIPPTPAAHVGGSTASPVTA